MPKIQTNIKNKKKKNTEMYDLKAGMELVL